jgi:hypothetical protein
VVLTLTIGLTSTTPLSTSTLTNQAQALENNVNEIIKKACPSYENTNEIKGDLINILESCLPESLQTPPTSPPSNSQTIGRNVLNVEWSIRQGAESHLTDKITIKDENSGASITLPVRTTGSEYLVIPTGNTYTVTVSNDFVLGELIIKGSNDCKVFVKEFDKVACRGIMGQTIQKVSIDFRA